MKRVILFMLFSLFSFLCYPQGLKNEGVYSKDQIETTLKDDIKQVISRDDRLSFAVKDMNFVADKNNKYMVDVSVKLFAESDLNNPKTTYAYAFKDIQEIKKDKVMNFKSSYDQIFINIDIRDISYISVEVNYTKLDDSQAKIYQEKLSGLLDFAFTSFNVGATIKNILGVTDEIGDEKITFSTKYYIPLNFEEHFEKIKSQIPVLIQSKDMILTMMGSNKLNNNSLLGKVKGFLNAGAQIICNQNVIPETDFEKITGFCTFSFSKTYNSSLPIPLDMKLKELMDASKKSEIDLTDELVKSVGSKAKEYLEENQISKRTYDNVIMYTNLVSIYNLRNNGMKKVFGVYSDEVVSKFSNWLDNSNSDAINYNFTKIFVRNIYQNGISNNKVQYNDGIIYIPYSLNNDITIYTLKLQQKLHEYVNNFLNGKSNYQQLVKDFTKQNDI